MTPTVVPTPVQQATRTRILVIAVGIIVMVAAGLGWYVWSGRIAEEPPTGYMGAMQPPINPKFAGEVLNQPEYTRLQRHGQYPVLIGSVGRNTPFAVVEYSATSTPPVTTGPLLDQLRQL